MGTITQQYVKPALSAGVRFPAGASDDVLERMLLHQIEAAAAWNTAWYLEQWSRGIEPACCAGCAGLKFVPDKLGKVTAIDVAPLIIADGKASCGPAVAMSLGHERAAKIRDGLSYEEAVEEVYPLLEKQPGSRYWHAVVIKDGERDDPTEEMPR